MVDKIANIKIAKRIPENLIEEKPFTEASTTYYTYASLWYIWSTGSGKSGKRLFIACKGSLLHFRFLQNYKAIGVTCDPSLYTREYKLILFKFKYHDNGRTSLHCKLLCLNFRPACWTLPFQVFEFLYKEKERRLDIIFVV